MEQIIEFIDLFAIWGKEYLMWIRDMSVMSWFYGSWVAKLLMYGILAYDAVSHVPQIIRNATAPAQALKEALAISQIMFNFALGLALMFLISVLYADPILFVNGLLFSLIYGISCLLYWLRTRHLD